MVCYSFAKRTIWSNGGNGFLCVKFYCHCLNVTQMSHLMYTSANICMPLLPLDLFLRRLCVHPGWDSSWKDSICYSGNWSLWVHHRTDVCKSGICQHTCAIVIICFKSQNAWQRAQKQIKYYNILTLTGRLLVLKIMSRFGPTFLG